MSDRVPLEPVQDKEPQAEEREYDPGVPTPEQTIDEMQDLHELAIMMGFENGFDGNSPEAIYSWAKNYIGEPGGPKVLAHIRETIKMIGATEKGPQLLRKLNMYASLDTKQAELQTKKENLML